MNSKGVFRTEKQVHCPVCLIDVDLATNKFPLDKPVIMSCPSCGKKIRVRKKLRLLPKERRGIELIVSECKKDGSGRRRRFGKETKISTNSRR